MMKALLAFLVVAVLLAGGGFWYWTTTPQYAVQQAAVAIKEHNVPAFHDWVDVQNLSSSAIQDLVADPVRDIGGAGLLERIVGIGIMSILRPTAVQSMSQQIDTAVAHRPEDDLAAQDSARVPKGILGTIIHMVKPPSLKETLRDYGFTKKNYLGLGKVTTDDQLSTVALRFYSPKKGGEIQVELELRKIRGQWRIMRILNLQEIVRSIASAAD